MLRVLACLALLVALLPAPTAAAQEPVEVVPVAFEVTNPLEPAATYTVRGDLYLPGDAEACGSSVMLLLHGLSYARWGWDFPIDPDTYSVARDLAERGRPALAIDELGYGDSDHPNGYTLTVQSYAAMTSQMIEQLRAGTYATGADEPIAFEGVGLMGHSAGTEIAELTAGLFGGVDVLVATAYTHFPSQRIAMDFFTGDVPRALEDDYEYFGGRPRVRAEYMYNLDFADPDVVERDNELANLTPSGEILSISNQPSRLTMGAIDVPVLLVLAEEDVLFPADFGEQELALFASSPEAELLTVPSAGHSFMLHPNAPETNDAIADWLDGRDDAVPACGG